VKTGINFKDSEEGFVEDAVQTQANQKVMPGRSVAIPYNLAPMAD
jgi:hypothetical protein